MFELDNSLRREKIKNHLYGLALTNLLQLSSKASELVIIGSTPYREYSVFFRLSPSLLQFSDRAPKQYWKFRGSTLYGEYSDFSDFLRVSENSVVEYPNQKSEEKVRLIVKSARFFFPSFSETKIYYRNLYSSSLPSLSPHDKFLLHCRLISANNTADGVLDEQKNVTTLPKRKIKNQKTNSNGFQHSYYTVGIEFLKENVKCLYKPITL